VVRSFAVIVVSFATLASLTAGVSPTLAGPVCEREYIVKAGDTLGQIAIDFDVEVGDILACNPDITDPNVIFVGQVLVIPGEADFPSPSGDGVFLQVVDKTHALPSSYVPEGLEDIDAAYMATGIPQGQLRAEANAALAAMIEQAAGDGQTLGVTSAYRSYNEQAATFQFWVSQVGLEEAERISARAGHSEHQLGTTADISGASVNYQLGGDLADAPEGQWLMAHAPEFGFALSYPEDGEPVTGYVFEPWHWRYVGVPFAEAWEAGDLVLVEFLEGLQVWGDVNCSGAVDPTDALAVLRGDAKLFYQKADGCPALADIVFGASGAEAQWGDVECGGEFTPVDSLILLRADAGLEYTQAEGCTEIGSKVPLVLG
jgi:LAS superfamily LD-carboxypeptidase LdcB